MNTCLVQAVRNTATFALLNLDTWAKVENNKLVSDVAEYVFVRLLVCCMCPCDIKIAFFEQRETVSLSLASGALQLSISAVRLSEEFSFYKCRFSVSHIFISLHCCCPLRKKNIIR